MFIDDYRLQLVKALINSGASSFFNQRLCQPPTIAVINTVSQIVVVVMTVHSQFRFFV